MRRSYSLRTRTAFFIAGAFALFLTGFFFLSYFSIEQTLLSRADEEVHDRLVSLASELDTSTIAFDTALMVSRHATTGEASLRITLYERSENRLRRVWTNRPKIEPAATELARQFLVDPARVTRVSSDGHDYHILAALTPRYLVVGRLDIIFLDEAKEAMLRVFTLLLVLGLIGATVIGFLIAGLSLAPIKMLSEGARKLGEREGSSDGKKHEEYGAHIQGLLPVPSSVAELASLALAVNKLIADRDESITQLRNFTADAAHELRTPLTILKGELEVELRLATATDLAKQVFRSNLEEVERLIVIVEDLLLLAKLDQKERPVRDQEVSIAESVHNVIGRLDPLVEGRQAQIRLDIAGPLRIEADPERVERMLYNIINNAITHSDIGGQIEIIGAKHFGVPVLTVHNRGVIAPEDLPHLFDRFYRAEKSRSRTAGGAGLGLAIVKSIADHYGFEVMVRSEQGFGTEFMITFRTAGHTSI